MAATLPFDILYNVFNYYAEFDHPSTPLETLLLVCKSWLGAAISHQGLWSTFKIQIQRHQDVKYWESCVKRRLARGSTHTLLDIDISRGISRRIPKDWTISYACNCLLSTLTGPSGEVSLRWRRFVVGYTFMFVQTDLLVRSLSFPTPNLEEFGICGLRGDHAILPDTRSLKVFDAVGLAIPRLPDLTKVTNLTIYANRQEGLDEKAVNLVVNVTKMAIRNWARFKLAATYPRLQSLSIEGTISEHCLVAFSAPNLNEIVLAVDRASAYLNVVSCKGIDLGRLSSATIGWPYRIEEDAVAEYVEGVRQFLMAAANLEKLNLWNHSIAIIVLKLLTDQCVSLYQSNVVLAGDEMELGRGESRLSSVAQFRERTGCNPDSSWDHILSPDGASDF